MNYRKRKKWFALFASIAFTLQASSQSSVLVSYTPESYNFSLSDVVFSKFYFPVFRQRQEIISKSPSLENIDFIKKNKQLVTKGHTAATAEDYFTLAESYWQLGSISAAKKILLNIVSSDSAYYTASAFHSSGTAYGYGSFTSNHKNKSCLLLVKIFIEEKNYNAALKYLFKADKEYNIYYTCGTGHNSYMNELKNLYAACYTGLGMTEKAITLHLSETFYSDDILITLLKKKYRQSELNRYLNLAIDNIMINRDNSPLLTYMESLVTGEDSLISISYSGEASTYLFKRKVILPIPHLQNGEKITRETVIAEFKKSQFYTSLYKNGAMN